MARLWSGSLARSARRLVVSAFLIFHSGATLIWVLPQCPLRAKGLGLVWYYMLPLGLWQSWGMFCPDPPQSVSVLEAEAIDVRGVRYNFAFPKQADYSVWAAIPRYRHPKFAVNLMGNEPELALNRMFAARHVVRQLAIPAEAFPVDVRLVYQVQLCPPPGSPPVDGPVPRQPFSAGCYRFASHGEVRP